MSDIEKKDLRTGYPVSDEFLVAIEIYDLTRSGELVWFDKLVHHMSDSMDKDTIIKCRERLIDYGILKLDYGETEQGKKGRRYYIDRSAEPTIRSLHEKYVIHNKILKNKNHLKIGDHLLICWTPGCVASSTLYYGKGMPPKKYELVTIESFPEADIRLVKFKEYSPWFELDILIRYQEQWINEIRNGMR